ncbi:hypothetical protein [Aquisphaera insulae]|uniref:hypothetical protein n=1 Tax=Aquisphaera insulae TaxID=2712864 RepID=UPI0013EDB8D4|nr:hypothetical protein [Aquisphaera insulae]
MTILHHGTTAARAIAIEQHGPDPSFREPGSTGLPTAEGLSAVIADGRSCGTGMPEIAARNKDMLFPDEGGPAIVEFEVPGWIMDRIYADPIAAALARGGEIRFEAESGLDELIAEWRHLRKRVILL